jgi:hypothetical protein
VEGRDYVLRLVALPDGVPAAVRLRRALKTLLRAYRLRCVSVEEVQAPAPATISRRGKAPPAA